MSEMVSFPSNGSNTDGYLALPASGRGPGVIVIQEWWGRNAHIKDIADRLAREGFVALAPDLYHGKITAEPDEAGKMMMAMKIDQAARDMAGAYDYLKSQEACTGKVGSVGFCMGGGLSLYISTLKPVDATVIFYGAMLPGMSPDLAQVKGPVLGHYADHDDWASPAAARALEKQLQDLGKQTEFHIYPDTQHAFFNNTRSEVHNAQASKQAWDRTLAFFRANLG